MMESREERSSLLVVENEEEEVLEPATPTGQYYNSSSLSLTILAALEFEIPLDDSQTMYLLQNVFLPINPRFSSIMVKDEDGEKQWKKVTVNLEDHVIVPVYPEGLPPESYDEYFDDYLTEISMEQLPQNIPLWKIYIFKYPTNSAAGTILFKLHHALGDGYSLMGALFTCLKRADNPSLPLTFPSLRLQSDSTYTTTTTLSDNDHNKVSNKKIGCVLGFVNMVINTISEFTWSFFKSNMLEDHVSPIRSASGDVEHKPISITTVSFSIDQLKQIKTKLGGTINDVMVGVIFYGTRLYMEAMNKGSGKASSTALVLLNTREITSYQTVEEMRKPNAKGPWGNNFGFFHVSIPKKVDLETIDPLEFVYEAKKMIKKKKNSLAVYLTGRSLELMRKIRGSEETASYLRTTINKSSISISNLIGPVEQMSLADHPIKGLYFVVVNVPQDMMITMVSYMGKMRVTVGANKEFIDHKLFNACLEKAFERIFNSVTSLDKLPQS